MTKCNFGTYTSLELDRRGRRFICCNELFNLQQYLTISEVMLASDKNVKSE